MAHRVYWWQRLSKNGTLLSASLYPMTNCLDKTDNILPVKTRQLQCLQQINKPSNSNLIAKEALSIYTFVSLSGTSMCKVSNFFSRLNSTRVSRPPQWGSSNALRHTTLGRTPLDQWSARRRNFYLTTHNTHKRRTSMPLTGFKPAIPASELPKIRSQHANSCPYSETSLTSLLDLLRLHVCVSDSMFIVI
jgi:hypothetical protein